MCLLKKRLALLGSAKEGQMKKEKSGQPAAPKGEDDIEIACVSPVIEDRYDRLIKNTKKNGSKRAT